MGKTVDDRKTLIYRFQRSYQDLVRPAGEEKIREPLVDIYETRDCLRIEVDLPGVKKTDVEAYTIGNRLFVRAFKREDLVGDGECAPRRFLCLEREFGEFYREIELLVACNASQAKARFENGILIIEFPKITDRRGVRKDLSID